MTDEFLDQLADRLLDKLLEKCSQPEWHVRRSDDFVNNLSGIIAFKENEEERMLGIPQSVLHRQPLMVYVDYVLLLRVVRIPYSSLTLVRMLSKR